ncbi:nuclear transport factor 2 family protein [Streptomyces sp. B-S-A8]|uniref:Nuclear transport factor 2 family protein n=1 Tax=Streptomyces solicavernae TaxID=3043614 RepID=A0ABT6RS67_9ACTN|nr:nuclear transport factor 2 family protein [Streptomyces sp. B-S-A8]MDI3387288.1 nuclear transport factor 2 family protein [Streptomyces sp. B-S-A8]
MNDDLPVELLADPAVRAFVAAVNAQDRDAFQDALAPGAAMSDDGTERNLAEWTEREIFSSNGRMAVESQSDDGLTLLVRYSNDTWGEMRTRWQFTVEGGKVARFDTGQV